MIQSFFVLVCLSLAVPVLGSTRLEFYKKNSKYVVVDDMVFERRDRKASGDLGEVQATSDYKIGLWPGGTLPIAFDSSISHYERNSFFEACRRWSQVANVRCVPDSSEYRNKIFVSKNNDGCWSQVGGTNKGTRRLNLANGCWGTGTIQHELGHALGFWHEQQRPDRDQFVQIHWENIEPGRESNFDIIRSSRILGPYDFNSIMHYTPGSFSMNSNPTISIRPEFADQVAILGTKYKLTEYDGQGMAALYGYPRLPDDAVVACFMDFYQTSGKRLLYSLPTEWEPKNENETTESYNWDCAELHRQAIAYICAIERNKGYPTGRISTGKALFVRNYWENDDQIKLYHVVTDNNMCQLK